MCSKKGSYLSFNKVKTENTMKTREILTLAIYTFIFNEFASAS